MGSTEVTQSSQKLQLLWFILGLRIAFFLIELGTAVWSHSLSLLAGAGHLFADLLTLGLTLVAAWVIQRQSSDQTTRNYQRLEAWVALLNGVSLGAIALLIAWEVVKHSQTQQPILGLPMLFVAGLSLVINGLTVQLLHPHSHHNLNFRGVFLHGVADTASSISVILAACAIYFFNWLWADAAASLLVALLISLSALSLIRDAWQVLRRNSTQPHREDTFA